MYVLQWCDPLTQEKPVSEHGSLSHYQNSYQVRASLQTFVQYASFSPLPFCHSVQADCSHFTCLATGFIKLKLPDRLGFCVYFLVIFFRRNMLDGHSGMPSVFWVSLEWRKADLRKHFVFSLSLFYSRRVLCLHVLWKRTFLWPRLYRKEIRRFLSPLMLQTFPLVLYLSVTVSSFLGMGRNGATGPISYLGCSAHMSLSS